MAAVPRHRALDAASVIAQDLTPPTLVSGDSLRGPCASVMTVTNVSLTQSMRGDGDKVCPGSPVTPLCADAQWKPSP